MNVDHNLLHRAQGITTGGNVHKIRNLTQVYINCCELPAEERSIAAERELRRYVNRELLTQSGHVQIQAA